MDRESIIYDYYNLVAVNEVDKIEVARDLSYDNIVQKYFRVPKKDLKCCCGLLLGMMP